MVRLWKVGSRALLLIIAAAALSGQSPPAVGEALLDRLIAVLPPPSRPATAVDPRRLERYTQLNPGRDADVRAVLERHQACVAPESMAATQRSLRRIASRLGEAGVTRLIEFYSGPDYRTFARLAPRLTSGEALSASDSAELSRILARYPVIEFGSGVETGQQDLAEDEALIEVLRRCGGETRAELARRGLRAN